MFFFLSPRKKESLYNEREKYWLNDKKKYLIDKNMYIY